MNNFFNPNNITHPIHDLLKQLDNSINRLNESVQNMDASSAELSKQAGIATEETRDLTKTIKALTIWMTIIAGISFLVSAASLIISIINISN